MKKLTFLAFIVLTTLLMNCSSDSAPSETTSNPDPTTNPDPTNNTSVTYNGNIAGVMSANCTSCHGDPVSQGAPMSLTTYSQVKSYIDIIIARVNSSTNPMPPAGLMPTNTRNLFQQWKDGGLLEN